MVSGVDSRINRILGLHLGTCHMALHRFYLTDLMGAKMLVTMVNMVILLLLLLLLF